MTTTPPTDASSLLVPIYLDAWVVDSQSQQSYAWYYANYDNLKQFQSPIPRAFNISDASKPAIGVHLHWALPDALTHGRAQPDAGPITFPLVPNRWLIARFNTSESEGWQCKLWVVQSDYLDPNDGTSPFLDPLHSSSMQVTPSSPTIFDIQSTRLGKSYTIEAWNGLTLPDGQLFLQAVGPANISFAAYVPFVQDVFSFVDSDLPPEGTGVYTYSYLVTGWYSDTQAADPLRGVTVYDPAVWQNQVDWESQTEAQRFQSLLTYWQWSIRGDLGTNPPMTSLYHGLVVDVEWPFSNAGVDPQNVVVAVGATGVDALAALIQAQAQREAKENPSQQNQWLAAGDTLAELIQAAIYDLLDDYTVPGGSVLIRTQIERAWFGASDGGVTWQVMNVTPQASGESPAPSTLTSDQTVELNKQLAALNQAQQALDAARRKLYSLQAELYRIWLKIGIANPLGWHDAPSTTPCWPNLKDYIEKNIYPDLINEVWNQLCAVDQAQEQIPNSNDDAAATQWANQNWSFNKPGGGTLTLSNLGLALKSAAMPPFWHPNDPVVLISGLHRSQKHGADGRYNKDGTLTCRLPDQSITGVQIPGQPTIDVTTLQSKRVNLNPCTSSNTIPSIPTLIHEAFLAEPLNAPLMANAVDGTAATIATGITDLLQQNSTGAAWTGLPPPPFAIRQWEQAWTPLFLEWNVQYYPTGSGSGSNRRYSPDDWQFDGEQYSWNGTGFDSGYYSGYTGRTLLTAQAPLIFQDKIEKYLANNTDIDSKQLDTLLGTVNNWDLLSQALSGLLDQLITLVPQETFPPPGEPGEVQCPPSTNGTPPSIATLVGGQYGAMPLLQGGGAHANYFYPVRGGFLVFQQLQVVDAFGQTYVFNFEQGSEPLLGSDLLPTNSIKLPLGAMQLSPRVIQNTRLDLRFLANDGSGTPVIVSDNPAAICGWLLPNHLDGGIAVYDAAGVALGELVALAAPDNWRPRPGDPGSNPPPQTPSDISNATLRAVVSGFAAQSLEVFADLLSVIDETLWMVDPLGGRKDQFLSVLIGRPLAVVQIELQLELLGDPAFNQIWNAMLPPQEPYSWLQDSGGVEDIPFPLRLGSLELRDDGLIGYFLPAEKYATFYTVHYPDEMRSNDQYVRQIVTPSGEYQGNISLNCNGSSVTVTLIIDPRGSVHAFMAILPMLSASLPPYLVEDFMRQLQVTFQTGPIIADPGTLRIPKPAEDQGVWNWVQRMSTSSWESDRIVDADDQARLPDGMPQLRDGWLQFSDSEE